ncbi:unnamed protein product [Paramecium primaurelia]|uniref:Uncharacterized protein n=1 Tax=Paramecium primaurelia TaxID=5886 RepID=A0A8S1MBP1_PARPR|nr:unnamed protein product [Paramecium primaurelia]
MGCLIQSETKNPSNYEEYNRYNKQSNRLIGGDSNHELSQNDLIAQAAERRLQNYEKRGLTPLSQLEFEQKKQKQEEAEIYKKEGRSQNYKWD